MSRSAAVLYEIVTPVKVELKTHAIIVVKKVESLFGTFIITLKIKRDEKLSLRCSVAFTCFSGSPSLKGKSFEEGKPR